MLTLKPISLALANSYVAQNHRHHDKIQGHKFSEGAYNGDTLVGVAIVGRPLSRHLDNGLTLEVTRVCTDGTHNACSFLYGACARIAKEMGYEKIITYTLASESGASLRASGWTLEGDNCGGGSWDCPTRPREVVQYTLFGEIVKYPTEQKKRWCKELKPNGVRIEKR